MDNTISFEKKKSQQLIDSFEIYEDETVKELHQKHFEPAQKEISAEEKKAQINVSSIRIPKKGFLSIADERQEYVTGQAKVSKNLVIEMKKDNKLNLQNKKLDEMLSVLTKKDNSNGLYSLDAVLDFLVPLPKIDLSTDKAIVENYEKIGEISDQLSKMSVFEDLLFTPELIDGFYAKSYQALRNMVSYAKLRIELIQDDLYQTATNSELIALTMIKPEDWKDDENAAAFNALREKLLAGATAERLLKYSLDELEDEKTGNQNKIIGENALSLSNLVADYADDTAELDKIKEYILLQKKFPEEVKSLLKKEDDNALFPQMEPGEKTAKDPLLSYKEADEPVPLLAKIKQVSEENAKVPTQVPMEAALDKMIASVKEKHEKNRKEQQANNYDPEKLYTLYSFDPNDYFAFNTWGAKTFDQWLQLYISVNHKGLYWPELSEGQKKEAYEEFVKKQKEKEKEEHSSPKWMQEDNNGYKDERDELPQRPKTNKLPTLKEVENRSKLPENFKEQLEDYDIDAGEVTLQQSKLDWDKFQGPDPDVYKPHNPLMRAMVDGFSTLENAQKEHRMEMPDPDAWGSLHEENEQKAPRMEMPDPDAWGSQQEEDEQIKQQTEMPNIEEEEDQKEESFDAQRNKNDLSDIREDDPPFIRRMKEMAAQKKAELKKARKNLLDDDGGFWDDSYENKKDLTFSDDEDEGSLLGDGYKKKKKKQKNPLFDDDGGGLLGDGYTKKQKKPLFGDGDLLGDGYKKKKKNLILDDDGILGDGYGIKQKNLLGDDDGGLLGDGYTNKQKNLLDDDGYVEEDSFVRRRRQLYGDDDDPWGNEPVHQKESVNNNNFEDEEEADQKEAEAERVLNNVADAEMKLDFEYNLRNPSAQNIDEDDLEFDPRQDMGMNAKKFAEGETEDLFNEEESEQEERLSAEEELQNVNAAEEELQDESVAEEEQLQNVNIAANEQQQNIDAAELQKQAQDFELEELRKDKENRELTSTWEAKDKYNDLLEHRIANHEDEPEIVEIKRDIFRLRLAIQDLNYEGLDVQKDYEAFKLTGDAENVHPIYGTHIRSTALQLFTNLISSCDAFIGTYKGKSKAEAARLELVKSVKERSQKDLSTFKAMLDKQNLRRPGAKIPNLPQIMLETMRMNDLREKLPQAIEQKIKGSRTKAKDLGELVAALIILKKEEPLRARDLTGDYDGSVAKAAVKKLVDNDFLKDFARQRNETLALLADKFRLFLRQDVPAGFLARDGQDPSDLTMRRQYALAKIRTDRLFYQLVGMDEILKYLSPQQKTSLSKYSTESMKGLSDEMRMLAKEGKAVFSDKTAPELLKPGALLSLSMAGENEVKKLLKDTLPPGDASENMKARVMKETIQRVYGEAGYEPENMTDAKIAEVKRRNKAAGKSLEAAKKRLTAEVDRIVKEKCKSILDQTQNDLCNVKTDAELRHQFYTMTDPAYLEHLKNGEDVSHYTSPVYAPVYGKPSYFAEEHVVSAHKSVEEKQSRIATGRPVMQRAVLHSQMADLLGMHALSPRAKFDTKEVDGQVKNGVNLEVVSGAKLSDAVKNKAKWSEAATEDRAKLLALNFLCGNAFQGDAGYVCDQVNGTITAVRMASNTQFSFGNMDSNACVKLLGKEGMAMLSMLDEATKEKIRTMGPITLASHFGYALDESERKALAERLSGLQKLLKSFDASIAEKKKLAEKKIEKYRGKLKTPEKKMEEVDNFRGQIEQQQRDLVSQLRAVGVPDEVLIRMDEYITNSETQKRRQVMKANEDVAALAKSEDITKMIRKNDQEMGRVVRSYRQNLASLLADYKESVAELIQQFKACTTAEQVEDVMRRKDDAWEVI